MRLSSAVLLALAVGVSNGLTAERAVHLLPHASDAGHPKTRAQRIEHKSDAADFVLVDGDMLMTRAALSDRAKRQASTNSFAPYPNGTVPYMFLDISNDAVREAWEAGIKFWNDNTCVDFAPATSEQRTLPYYVLRLSQDYKECYAMMDTPKKEAFLGEACGITLSSATHEIEHSLGVFHQHMRADAADYITFDHDNIDDSSQNRLEPSNTFGIPYDYTSVMHYEANANVKNGSKPAFIVKDERYNNSLSNYQPSFYDVLIVNRIYNCSEKCDRQPSAHCDNGGYPHPRDCLSCLCPRGFGGADCRSRQNAENKECGQTLYATETEAQYVIENVGTDVGRKYINYTQCGYHVIAPEGKVVQFDVREFRLLQDYTLFNVASEASVEVKIHEDPRMGGVRSTAYKPQLTATSPFRVLPFVVSYEGGFRRLHVSYRAVDPAKPVDPKYPAPVVNDMEPATTTRPTLPETEPPCETSTPARAVFGQWA